MIFTCQYNKNPQDHKPPGKQLFAQKAFLAIEGQTKPQITSLHRPLTLPYEFIVPISGPRDLSFNNFLSQKLVGIPELADLFGEKRAVLESWPQCPHFYSSQRGQISVPEAPGQL